MEVQAQPQSESQQQPNAEQSRQDVERQVVENNRAIEAQIEARRKERIAAFRASQGVSAPAAQAPAQQAPAQIQAQAPAPIAQPNASDPQAIAQAFTAQLNQQYAEAQRIRQEAVAQAQAAQARAEAAEARLAQFEQNPASYLQSQNLTVDEWNARLANGGEPTPEEKRLAAERARWEAEAKSLRSEVTQVKQAVHQDQESRAVAELAPVLAQQFPLVNELFGPQAILVELQNHVKATNRALSKAQVDAYIGQMENSLLAQQKALLQKESIATKLGLSVKSSQAVVAEQSPQTLSNRVTSTVAPSTSRPTTERERIARGRAVIQQLIAASPSRRPF